jgi:SanA protein
VKEHLVAAVSTHGERPGRTLAIVLAACVLLAAVVVPAANVVVVERTDHAVIVDAAAVRPAAVAIMPGSRVRPDGSLGGIVRQRVDAAVALYRDGRVEKLFVSGDHGRPDDNEPDATRDAALASGVAPEDVFTDYAGFDTWHTMRRARDIFGVTTAVVVTQAPGSACAVDLARAAGLDAQGLVTGDGGRTGREVFARVRGLGQATFPPEVTGRSAIPIHATAGRPGRGSRTPRGRSRRSRIMTPVPCVLGFAAPWMQRRSSLSEELENLVIDVLWPLHHHEMPYALDQF